jgi:tetratricopeptide (TPR) repeat protein
MDSGQREAVRIARRFYAGSNTSDLRCVVTGRDHPNWHHLDEAVPRWWHYTNIIPLDAGLNQALDKRRYRYLPAELDPNVLEAKGLSHYRHGRFPQGYACDRLASFQLSPPRGDVPQGGTLDPSRALEFAAFSLLQLHALSALPLAIDTLKRSVLPVLCSKTVVTRRAAARVVTEIESYYRNYGLLEEAIECCDLVAVLLQTDNSDNFLVADRARVLQHKGITLGARGQEREAREVLDTAMEELQRGARYVDGQGNDALWRARALLRTQKQDLDFCRKLIRRVYDEYETGKVGVWAMSEAVWTHAEIEYARGRTAEAHEHLLRGRDLFYGAGIVPSALFPLEVTRSFKEKYPRDLYVLPRSARTIRPFRTMAGRVIRMVEERLKRGSNGLSG